MILIPAAAIDPVYTGAVAADAFLEHGAYGFMQRPGLNPFDGIGQGQGM
jgi:hypothetical protein